MTGFGREHPSVAPLRIPTFRRLWLALLFFNLGHLVQVVASSWLILELTGSPLWVSLMVGAPTLPMLFLALPAGAAADLFDRRRVLIVSSAIMVAASSGMALVWMFDLVTPARLVGLGVLLGVGVAFFNPAWQAMIPALVPIGLVPGAVALNSSSGGIATALGPAIGGVLVATVGPGYAFGLGAVGYAVILGALVVTRTREWPVEGGPVGIAIATGLRYLRFSRSYRWLLVVGALFGFSSAALRAMLPNITSDVLLEGSTLYGILLGAFGLGAVLGGVSRAQGARILGDRMIAASILSFGAASTIAGASQLVPVTATAVFVAGLLWTWILSTLNSTFQLLTPDWVRGRTMSAFVLSIFGALPLGAAASGAVGDLIGAGPSLVVFSMLIMGLGAVAWWLPIPVLEDIEPPVLTTQHPPDIQDEDSALGPVMVINSWTITESEFEPFLEILAELRRLRLSTGAYQWRVYRNTAEVGMISEIFMVHSWEQHLQQHRRMDTQALLTLSRAASYGQREATHLVEFDVDRPRRRPDWESLVADHARTHRSPGGE